MANYLLKNDTIDLEPAEFEDLSLDADTIIRAYKHGKKSNNDRTDHPLANNLIRNKLAQLKTDSVEVCIAAFDHAEDVGEEEESELPEEEQALEAEQVEALKKEWDEAWQLRLDEMADKVYAQAYAKGYEDAQQTLTEKVEEEQKVFKEALQNLQNNWSSFINRSETLLLEIALEIAHFLVDAPLPERYSKSTERALLEALEILSREAPLRLSLNPVDFLRLQESGVTKHIEDQFSTLRWDPQPTLKEGNWIIQTPRQAIRRVSTELLASLRDRFGLSENIERDLEPRETPSPKPEPQIPPVTNIAVTTTAMANKQEQELTMPMSFSSATSTATPVRNPALSKPNQENTPAFNTQSQAHSENAETVNTETVNTETISPETVNPETINPANNLEQSPDLGTDNPSSNSSAQTPLSSSNDPFSD